MSDLGSPLKVVEVMVMGEKHYHTEVDVSIALFLRAIKIARDPGTRWHLSSIRRSIAGILNTMHLGRMEYMRAQNIEASLAGSVLPWSDYAIINSENPFPQSCKVRDQILELMTTYCMKQSGIKGQPDDDWNDGWETEIVTRLLDLMTETLVSYGISAEQIHLKV